MRRTLRLAVLTTAVLASLAGMSGGATAATWDNDGDTSFTATGPADTLTLGTGVSLPCTDTTSTGTTTTVTTTWNHCTLAGTPYSVECHSTLTLGSQSGAPGHLVTSGTADQTCGIFVFTTKVCHIQGTRPFDYINPTTGATPGRWTWTHATLTLSNGPAGTCPFGNASATFHERTEIVTGGSGGPLPHNGPDLTLTP